MFAAWRLEWPRRFERQPTEDDLVYPRDAGATRTLGKKATRDAFLKDLASLGFRPRRLYDLRRSYVTSTLDDGGDPNVIRRISHPRPSDAFSSYQSIPWERTSAEASRLRIVRRTPALVVSACCMSCCTGRRDRCGRGRSRTCHPGARPGAARSLPPMQRRCSRWPRERRSSVTGPSAPAPRSRRAPLARGGTLRSTPRSRA